MSKREERIKKYDDAKGKALEEFTSMIDMYVDGLYNEDDLYILVIRIVDGYLTLTKYMSEKKELSLLAIACWHEIAITEAFLARNLTGIEVMDLVEDKYPLTPKWELKEALKEIGYWNDSYAWTE